MANNVLHVILSTIGVLVLLSSVSNASAPFQDTQKPDSFAVFGYLPQYRYNAPGGFNYTAAFQMGLTHLIFYGGVHPSKSYMPIGLDTLPTKAQMAEARLAADNIATKGGDEETIQKGKLLLCIGGSGLNGGFAGMAAADKLREMFLTDLNELLLEHGFDGVDYRWEYPLTPEEWTDFRDFIAQSKEMLLDGEAIITITLGFSRQHMREVKENDIATYADFIHYTAYDQRDRHSTVAFAEQVIKMVTVKGDLGSNANNAIGKKLTLGLPFYGRKRNGVESKAYNEIVPVVERSLTKQLEIKMKGKSATEVKSAVEAELHKTDEYQKMYWNSRNTIKQKTLLAKEAGLGGIMIWELGQDVQPCDSPKALMWGIKEALTGLTRREFLAQRGADEGDL